jgi:hypothetical protein
MKTGQKFKLKNKELEGIHLYSYQDKVFFLSKNRVYETSKSNIKEILEEVVDPTTLKYPLMPTQEQVINSEPKELINIALANFKHSTLEDALGEDIYLKVKKVGRLVKGNVYSHETKRVYPIISLEVEADLKYSFQDKAVKTVGLLPLYSLLNNVVNPTYFLCELNKFNEEKFKNGCGDYVKVTSVYGDYSNLKIDFEKYST